MTNRQQELLKAIEFVRKTFADRRINLDYSAGSVHHLDTLFDEEFRNGKLKNPEGGFAKFQGLIMIGISGYLAEVITGQVPGSKISLEESDQNWFVNFKIISTGNRFIQPGKQLLQRVIAGKAASLSGYIHSARKYLNGEISEMPANQPLAPMGSNKKPWWQIW